MPVHAIANIRASEAIKTYLEKIWIAKTQWWTEVNSNTRTT